MGIDDPEVVALAIESGYRHLDTAQIYGNEAVVGDGIEAASVDREELLVATKVWATDLGYDDVLRTTRESLDRLRLDSVDLLYVHRPIDAYDPAETLPAFDELRDEGLISHVGVSNFDPDHLAAARDHLEAPIVANQVEVHPLYRPTGALADASERGYALVAYAPLGDVGRSVPELEAVAEKHGTTEAAVSIAWVLSKENAVTIPKASSREHLTANLDAATLELDAEDVARIDGIDRRDQLYPE
ncbi:MAG: aldo/keto reductase [Salinigranum sp.]